MNEQAIEYIKQSLWAFNASFLSSYTGIDEEVFPNSNISIRSNYFAGQGLTCSGRLAKDKSECYNGIIKNDPLTYHFLIENGNYTEYRIFLLIKPSNKFMAYGSIKLRKKSIKNVTPEKLKARFKQVKQLVIDNKDNFINLCFDINDKI